MRHGQMATEAGRALSASLKAAVVAAPLFGAGAVGATDLRIAIGNPATHAHSYGYDRYAAFLDENTAANPTVYHLSLLSLSEIPDGLRDGIAGMGAVITAYMRQASISSGAGSSFPNCWRSA